VEKVNEKTWPIQVSHGKTKKDWQERKVAREKEEKRRYPLPFEETTKKEEGKKGTDTNGIDFCGTESKIF